MVKRFVVLLVLLFYTGSICADDTNVLERIESSARAWLALTDSGQYTDSWEKASSLLQKGTSKSEWIKTIGAIRKPLGSMEARYIATAGTTDSLSGLPDGEYVVVQFYTKFKRQVLALETLTMAKEADDTWRVAEYAFK
mgnify:CR=1 FL=1|tara:strand:+ start:1791 stop:2207 length:417 start_codon:yes stop_codon:yes gene_type:complete